MMVRRAAGGGDGEPRLGWRQRRATKVAQATALASGPGSAGGSEGGQSRRSRCRSKAGAAPVATRRYSSQRTSTTCAAAGSSSRARGFTAGCWRQWRHRVWRSTARDNWSSGLLCSATASAAAAGISYQSCIAAASAGTGAAASGGPARATQLSGGAKQCAGTTPADRHSHSAAALAAWRAQVGVTVDYNCLDAAASGAAGATAAPGTGAATGDSAAAAAAAASGTASVAAVPDTRAAT